MKPIKLKMTAFGPYKDTEIIDFTELQDHRLFVVSGPTGAGKTTIFDAICFAIYGQASGDDRSEVRMLRSHFATEDVHTSVQFRFELKGRIYEVFRQLGHVKTGNKTETGERHELYEVIRDELVLITDRQSKRPVDEKLQQLMGLTREQFSQIVMLPQGEFRKFLVSDTDNKETILRNVFKTNLYKKVEVELDARRKEAKKELDEQLNLRSVFINSLFNLLEERSTSPLKEVLRQEHVNMHQVLTNLEEEIKASSAETLALQQKLAAENKLHKEQTELYHQAKALNERFVELEKYDAKRLELEQQQPLIAAKQAEAEAARQAKQIQVYDQLYMDLEKELKIHAQLLETAKQEVTAAQLAWEEAEKRYQHEEGQASVREQLVRDLERLQSYQPLVQSIDEKKQSITALNHEVNELKGSAQQIADQLKQVRSDKERLLNLRKQFADSVHAYPEKLDQLTAMRELAQELREYLKLQKLHQTSLEEERKRLAWNQEAQEFYARLESRWFHGQASILAEHLQDGKACPVCGSTEHPAKASHGEEIPTRQRLEQARKEKNDAEQRYLEAKTNLSHVKQQLIEAERKLQELQVDQTQAQDRYERLLIEGKQLKQDVESMKDDQTKLAKTDQQIEQLEKQEESLEQQKEQIQQRLQQHLIKLEKEEAVFLHSLENIPEELRSLQALMQLLHETKKRKEHADAAWKAAQQAYREANERRLTAHQQVEHLTGQQTELEQKRIKAKQELTQQLKMAGFEEIQAYREAKRTDDEIAALEKEINAYRREWEVVLNRLKQLEALLHGKQPPKLKEMLEQLNALEKQVDQTREMLIQQQTYAAKLIELQSSIELADQQVQQAEAKLQEVVELYDLIRGDNPLKISFERYLQIEFLEQIIEAANIRLLQLSNGQFMLVRSERLESRGKQSGLGLDVLDQYTGQYRDVKTLSGGEKFNASLCLALGMADVIQAYEGGISIETMFIDEGFGSLDEESLNKAIETLIDLQQSGRIVGVISHVAELKQRIPAILEVTKMKEGHSRTQFLIESTSSF